MLKALDPYRWLIGAGLVATIMASLWGYGKLRYNAGYETAKAEATTQVALERSTEVTRQVGGNMEALSAAYDTITALDLDNEKLRAKLSENKLVAAQAPDASRVCTPPDSVRRIQAIR